MSEYPIEIGNSLAMGRIDTPTREGEVVNSLAEVEGIPTPYVGMRFYDKETKREYVVTALKMAVIKGVEVDNAVVGSYVMVARKGDVDDEVSRAIGKEGELEQAIRNNAEGVNTAKADIQSNRSAIVNVDNKVNANSLRIEEVATTTNSKIETEVAKINKKISNEIAKVVGGAPESFDTLQEIAGWIENDETGAAAIANEVATNASDISRLRKAVFPLKVALSLSPSTMLEYTGENKLFTLSWSITEGGERVDDVDSITVSYGGKTESVSPSAQSVSIGAANDTNITVTVKAHDMTATAQIKANFAYRWFSGVVDADYEISESSIKQLAQSGVTDSKANSVTYSPFTLKKVVYAFAAEYGSLGGIVDLNNINLINNYSKSTVGIGGVTYNVYVTKQEFSVEGNITYKYQ